MIKDNERTTAQLGLTWEQYEKEVAARLKDYIALKWEQKHIRLLKKLWKDGYGIPEAVSFMILNN